MNSLHARGEYFKPPFILWCAITMLFGVFGERAAHAQGFAAIISPPRFELFVKPGEKTRQVIEITNASTQLAKYYLKTADWALDKNGGVSFDETLQAGSCRPWVAIEAREISVSGGGKYRYRFEIAVPADAPPGECRFALLVEGDARNRRRTRPCQNRRPSRQRWGR